MKRLDEKYLTTVDLVRHGQCQGGEIYRGSTDVELTELGWQQMTDALAANLSDGGVGPWDKIITSPLKRCRLFAESKAQQWQLPLAVEENFREMNFGDWEGRPMSEVHEQHKAEVEQFYRDPSQHTPRNGEPVLAVQARMLSAWQSIMAAHQGQHLLLIQHGVSIRVLLLSLLNMPLAQMGTIEIPYAGMARLKVYTGGQRTRVVLAGLNRIS
ncbi:histidine phosphatase family protein [Halioxenophilus sp. WMMB6]|uniref:histidine phosphatase family protein n=1 Tax=Halioxenophilus sp. WMMB6 TaxID=3073815 RepID=UPI00295E8606|nr:histidine phosphatase family protein [Halioxenophilus sp. WMMB6]